MLRRPQKKSGFGARLFKGFIVAELTALAGAFYLWNRMNRSQEFRKYMNNNYPYILEGFYSVGETLDSTYCTRSIDLKQWELENRKVTGQ